MRRAYPPGLLVLLAACTAYEVRWVLFGARRCPACRHRRGTLWQRFRNQHECIWTEAAG